MAMLTMTMTVTIMVMITMKFKLKSVLWWSAMMVCSEYCTWIRIVKYHGVLEAGDIINKVRKPSKMPHLLVYSSVWSNHF